MNNKLKTLLKWGGIFILCFIVIYLFVFLGGWRLFESGDPILIEIGVALVLSFFIFVFNELITERVKSLEERLNELENNQ